MTILSYFWSADRPFSWTIIIIIIIFTSSNRRLESSFEYGRFGMLKCDSVLENRD